MSAIEKFIPLLSEQEDEGRTAPILQRGELSYIYVKHVNLFSESSRSLILILISGIQLFRSRRRTQMRRWFSPSSIVVLMSSSVISKISKVILMHRITRHFALIYYLKRSRYAIISLCSMSSWTRCSISVIRRPQSRKSFRSTSLKKPTNSRAHHGRRWP